MSRDIRGAKIGGKTGGNPAAPARLTHLLAIGGLDPTGGAGLVRDFLTARSWGASAQLIATAWTEQSGVDGVLAVEPRDPAAVSRAIRDAWTPFAGTAASPVSRSSALAVKIGMLPDGASAHAVGRALEGFPGPVVLDPVLGASSGGSLYRGDLRPLLALASRATLLTPNALEASMLTGLSVANLEAAAEAGRALCQRGVPAVLVKGGHLEGAEATDILVTPAGERAFVAPRRPGANVRGTGCALATAIAVNLGRGLPLEEAIKSAKAWLGDALAAAVDLGGERHLS